MKKIIVIIGILGLVLGGGSSSFASTMVGGDAINQASANAILDIVFAIDTSGSMSDEISGISTTVQNVIQNLDCPNCDVWVRARFMGINGTSGSVFNETVRNYVLGTGNTPTVDHLEDNGPAVTDLVNYYAWNNDAVAGQNYYKAVVTIGDEGTENGQSVNQADWDAAYAANQAAIANNVFVFSVLGTPFYADAESVFKAMAIGGSGGGYSFLNTGGTFVKTNSNTLETDLESIFCIAGGGGNNQVPEPATMLLLGSALIGLWGFRRKK